MNRILLSVTPRARWAHHQRARPVPRQRREPACPTPRCDVTRWPGAQGDALPRSGLLVRDWRRHSVTCSDGPRRRWARGWVTWPSRRERARRLARGRAPGRRSDTEAGSPRGRKWACSCCWLTSEKPPRRPQACGTWECRCSTPRQVAVNTLDRSLQDTAKPAGQSPPRPRNTRGGQKGSWAFVGHGVWLAIALGQVTPKLRDPRQINVFFTVHLGSSEVMWPYGRSRGQLGAVTGRLGCGHGGSLTWPAALTSALLASSRHGDWLSPG